MNYHNITKDDMLNGSGLRVCLWLSGCSHHCDECQNPQTWNPGGGIEFDSLTEQELFSSLRKPYISGITFSGGDPLHENNLSEVLNLVNKIRFLFKSEKNIWLYTGYEWEQIFAEEEDSERNKDSVYAMRREIVSLCDVVVDGRFKKELADVNYPYAGSTNQRVIDVKKSIDEGKVILWEN